MICQRYMPVMAKASSYRPIAGALLKGYKLTLSPAFMACGIQCRHAPSCSEYCLRVRVAAWGLGGIMDGAGAAFALPARRIARVGPGADPH